MNQRLLLLSLIGLLLLGATAAVLLRSSSRRPPREAASSGGPEPTPRPRYSPEQAAFIEKVNAPPVPVEWPELRALDELVHQAHGLSTQHNHATLYSILPQLLDGTQKVLASPVPKLPGADPAWMQRRVQALQANAEKMQELIAKNIQPERKAGQPFWWQGDPAAYKGMGLHEAVNALIDNVEVLMGATAAEHKFITRAEHVHTDHQCGP